MRLLRLVLLSTALLLTPQALAATLQLSPTQVQLSAETPTVALTLTNTSASASVVKVNVFAWAQEADQDVLTPTADVIAVPPLFTLAGGATQVVRVALRRPVTPAVEQSYRLLLEEVPGPAGSQAGTGLAVLLHLSVPVFVPPASVTAAPATWTLTRTTAGLQLTATNSGNTHLQVTRLTLRSPGSSAALFDLPVYGYVLPGQTHRWTVPPVNSPAGQSLELTAETNRGPVRASVLLTP